MSIRDLTISERLISIETKLDEVLKGSTDHEVRLRLLEKSLGKIIGVSSAAGGIIGVVLTYIMDKFR